MTPLTMYLSAWIITIPVLLYVAYKTGWVSISDLLFAALALALSWLIIIVALGIGAWTWVEDNMNTRVWERKQ